MKISKVNSYQISFGNNTEDGSKKQGFRLTNDDKTLLTWTTIAGTGFAIAEDIPKIKNAKLLSGKLGRITGDVAKGALAGIAITLIIKFARDLYDLYSKNKNKE